jgi:hypothetical protein
MSILTTTATTFALKGIREDLSNIISNISPTQTPFMTRAGKASVSNTLFEWQTDALATALSTNQQLEGDDLAGAYTAITATKRVGNYAQISRKTVSVSGTSDAVNKAGRRAELAYQIQKMGLELRRDMEKMLLENIAGTAGSTSAARKTAGLPVWLQTNTFFTATDGGDSSWDGTGVPTPARTDGTNVAASETNLKAVIAACFAAGAEPNVIMAGPFNRAALSAFTGIATTTFDISKAVPAAIIGSANVYVSNFGTFEIVPNRFQRERDVFLLDFDYVSVAYLRPFMLEQMAKTGDAENRMLLAEYGLMVKNEAALGLLADCTTA